MLEESHQGPVTALAAWNGFLWAGTGGFLRKYCLKSRKFLDERRIFTINRIKGIIVDEHGIVCWGERNYSCGPDSTEFDAEDWVISGLATSSNLFLLTAHNAVLTVDRCSGKILETRRCKAERSILYSGALYLSDEGNLLAAAGTVLGGVLIWDVAHEKVIWRLRDHEGSIFGVAFNSNGTRLASCSDDRSIFIWNLETGKALSRGWGHVARIWQLVWASPTKLISVSEDCSVREWDPTTMKQLRSSTGHEGRHVWSLTTTASEIITGGGDSRIIVWDAEDTVFRRREWVPSEITGLSSYVRSIEFTEQGPEVCLSTNQSYVLYDNEWKMLPPSHVPSPTPSLNSSAHLKGSWQFGQKGNFHSLSISKTYVAVVRDAAGNIIMEDAVNSPVTTAACISNTYFVGTRFGQVIQLGGPRIKFGKDAITDITEWDHELLVVTSRSGRYCYLNSKMELLAEFKTSYSIEGLYGDICFGFWKDKFIAWDLVNNVELWSEVCGGGHRTWAADPQRLMYTRGGQMIFVEIARKRPQILSPNTHGREIRAMAANPVLPNVVATAGEDTLIGLCRLKNNRLVADSWLCDHKSAPHTLAWHESGNLLVSAGSREELFIWDITMDNPILARCIFRLPPSGDADLRITDLAFLGNRLAASYSNSTVNVWHLTEENKLSLEKTFSYSGCCLFTVHFMGDWVLASASDGCVLAWKLDDGHLIKHRAHQSGIRACSVQGSSVWTGGDDNAICVMAFKNEIFQPVSFIKNAHSSTVTAILPLNDGSAISTSSDQKLRRWLPDGSLIDSDICNVCDTGLLEQVSNRLVVGGCGLSFYSID